MEPMKNINNDNEPKSNAETHPATAPQGQPHPTQRPTQKNQYLQFLELRAQGVSLAKISEAIGVPKSTLYGWNLRNRDEIDQLKRLELEALEERLLGSQNEQFSALTKMLHRLEKAFERKLEERERYLSVTELFWMAANLRQHLQRFRDQKAVTDVPDPRVPADRFGTLPDWELPVE